jgi:aspartyl-tRNA(Asn)/glutamyl-tRNA(Gln) amidotransferase subunit B
MEYEPIIGLEVHAQLKTESKMFCPCRVEFGAEPNTNVCPVCLGLPGALPVVNRKAVEMAVLVSKALHAEIGTRSVFARKNYFYPDLPKGYQISQYDRPLATGGRVLLESGDGAVTIRLSRIHLEEDAGKSFHTGEGRTLVDMNRCGVPLLEIVSEPDMRSPEEAYRYLSELRRVLMYLDVCDGHLEEGSIRCDANLSMRRRHSWEMSTRTEIKNLNSLRGVEKGLEAAIDRQIESLESRRDVAQETMLWDAGTQRLVLMRAKEEAHDYRYFPEPDLLPLKLETSWLRTIASEIPELPMEKLTRFMDEYRLPRYDAEILTQTRPLADYYEGCVRRCRDPKAASNWIMTEVLREVGEKDVSTGRFPVRAELLGDLLNLIAAGTINRTTAKEVFGEMISGGGSAQQIVESKGLAQLTDEATLAEVAREGIGEYPAEVEKVRAGREGVFSFLVGEVMKRTQGRANPRLANEVLRDLL